MTSDNKPTVPEGYAEFETKLMYMLGIYAASIFMVILVSSFVSSMMGDVTLPTAARSLLILACIFVPAVFSYRMVSSAHGVGIERVNAFLLMLSSPVTRLTEQTRLKITIPFFFLSYVVLMYTGVGSFLSEEMSQKRDLDHAFGNYSSAWFHKDGAVDVYTFPETLSTLYSAKNKDPGLKVGAHLHYSSSNIKSMDNFYDVLIADSKLVSAGMTDETAAKAEIGLYVHQDMYSAGSHLNLASMANVIMMFLATFVMSIAIVNRSIKSYYLLYTALASWLFIGSVSFTYDSPVELPKWAAPVEIIKTN